MTSAPPLVHSKVVKSRKDEEGGKHGEYYMP
eukprot:CAMPEP_0114372568 /NCGR_PEP_ID=MMETSP0101-20121206/34265_1 /TAXON_ID=38822 ORGANISM="Pteridomonas danica, Strain PT" /NCGR_SAMPLE_ID=MMETSP0101 /ASSEMBLY_ACC=CAM_ASM_000211 /LENGTH=30 /DNA_ID= /DNA_START= /DNA_END= /DNA_ORIENTATION=